MAVVHWLYSIRAKFFYAISLIVGVTVMTIAWHDLTTYRRTLIKQTETAVLNEANEARRLIEARIESFSGQAGYLMRDLSSDADPSAPARVQAFVDANRELVGAVVLVGGKGGGAHPLGTGWTTDTTSPRFEDETPADVRRRAFAEVTRQVRGHWPAPGKPLVVDLYDATKVPVVAQLSTFADPAT